MDTELSVQRKMQALAPQIFWVSPSQAIPAQTIQLPAGDQIGINIITPAVMCLKTTEEFDEGHFIHSVQRAAAGTVAEIPALAGKVVFEDKTCKALKCVIPEDAKIEVRVKKLPHLDADELDAKHWPTHYLSHSEICMSTTPTFGIDTYNFAVQANILQGGIVFTLLMNHIILDGVSQANVRVIFAHHLSRAMDRKEPTPSGLMPPAALDKSTANGTHPARPILDWKDWRKAPVTTTSPEESTAALYAKISTLTNTIWYLSPEKQAELRARSQDPQGPKLSTHTCFSIWLWRAITRARRLSPETVTRNLTTTQTRGRVESLHPRYPGSALVYGRAKATVEELLQPRKPNTSELAARITASVAWWTPARIREFWGSIEDHTRHEGVATLQPNRDRDWGVDVEFSNVTNTGFYQLHWGRGLTPASSRVTKLAFADGYVIMGPKHADGGFDLTVFLERETLKRLVRDPEFRDLVVYRAASDPTIDDMVAMAEIDGGSDRAKL